MRVPPKFALFTSALLATTLLIPMSSASADPQPSAGDNPLPTVTVPVGSQPATIANTNATPFALLTVKVDGTDAACNPAVIPDAGGAWSCTLEDSFGPGSHGIEVIATDPNDSTNVSPTVTGDLVVSALALDPVNSPIAPSDNIPVTGTYDSGLSGATVAVTLKNPANSPVGAPVPCTLTPGTGTFSCTINPSGNLGFGDYTVEATQTVVGATPITTSQPVAVQPLKAKQCATNTDNYGSKAVVTVGTWNIAHAQVTKNTPGWTWTDRRTEAINYLVKCAADVYNLQEIGASFLPDPDEDGIANESQMEQLVRLLNDKLEALDVRDRYAYTNPIPRGGPNDNRILYNTATVDMVSQGYSTIPSKNTEPETLSYATLKTRAVGTAAATRFFIATTHLTSGAGQDMDNFRRSQMNIALKAIKSKNPSKYPTILSGDFNTSRYVMWANATDLAVSSSLKLVDVIGNDRKIYKPKKAKPYRGSCTAQQSSLRVPYTSAARKNAFYNSSNGTNSALDPTANQCKPKWHQNGRAIDYIFTSRNIRPKTWETVVPYDGKGYYKPTTAYLPSGRRTPSDHNLIVSKVVLLPATPAWK